MTEDTQNNETENMPKYPSPKVLLIDVDNDVSQYLKQSGYNISDGSFGKPYNAPDGKSSRYQLRNNNFMPEHYSESEIVVIDLSSPSVLSEPSGNGAFTRDGDPILTFPVHGVINPRPFSMWMVQDNFDRILDNDGLFIIFAGEKEFVDFSVRQESTSLNGWQFLRLLSSRDFKLEKRTGREVIPTFDEGGMFAQLIDKYVNKSSYKYILSLSYDLRKVWRDIAKNKYGETISGLFYPIQVDKGGWILIFPEIQNKAEFLSELLLDYLPHLSPTLFPFNEHFLWTQSEEYEIPKILIAKNDIEEIRKQAAREIKEIQAQIEVIRSENQYLNDIITQTGAPLELAVKRGLEILGFNKVIHLDSESGENREDLQIRDRSTLLLIETKGLSRAVKESQAMQVQKYVAPRMKAEGNFDVRGLAIINHDRGLPPLDRDPEPFTDVVKENAIKDEFGLMTSVTLYRLIRNFLTLRWKHEHVADLFYQNGVIEPIPTHYEYLGLVDEIYDSSGAFTIIIESGEIKLGDKIAFDKPLDYLEQDIESLEIDHSPVNVVETGKLAGIGTTLTKKQIGKGTRVFRVKQ